MNTISSTSLYSHYYPRNDEVLGRCCRCSKKLCLSDKVFNREGKTDFLHDFCIRITRERANKTPSPLRKCIQALSPYLPYLKNFVLAGSTTAATQFMIAQVEVCSPINILNACSFAYILYGLKLCQNNIKKLGIVNTSVVCSAIGASILLKGTIEILDPDTPQLGKSYYAGGALTGTLTGFAAGAIAMDVEYEKSNLIQL